MSSVVFDIGEPPAQGSLTVIIEGACICRLEQFPIHELVAQLVEWSAYVDDSKKPACFIFQSDTDTSLVGAFRIEPRSIGWEFTSTCEIKRQKRTLPLEEFRHAIRVLAGRLLNPKEYRA